MRVRLFWIIFAAALSVHFYNFGAQRLYPFLDMPNHLALAEIYHSWDDPGTRFERFFELSMFPRPNVFHTVFCGSGLFPDIEVANKVFFLLYAVMFAAAVLLVILRCGGNLWYGLLAFLLLYNINVGYGFVGFVIALPVLLLVLYVTINYLEQASLYAAFVIACLLAVLFFMHAMAFLFGLMVFAVCAAIDMLCKGSWRRVYIHLALCVPGGVLFCLWYAGDVREFGGTSMVEALLRYYRSGFLGSFWQRGAVMIHDNFRLTGSAGGYAAAAFLSLVIIFFALYAFMKARPRQPDGSETPRRCVWVFLGCSVFCALFMPVALPGYSFLYQRFSVCVFLALLLSAACYAPAALPARMTVLLVAAVAFHALAWVACFRDFDAENAGFNRDFFSGCSRDGVLAALIYDYRFRDVSMYDNFADYYMVWTGGVSTTRLVDDRSFAIRRRVGTDQLPEYMGWIGKAERSRYDGRYGALDYILVRGEIPEQAGSVLRDFRLLNRAGAWRLYANRAQIPEVAAQGW